jgi:hypothetical protein
VTTPAAPAPEASAIPGWPTWRVEDFNLFLRRLLTRFPLAENGIVSPQDLRR